MQNKPLVLECLKIPKAKKMSLVDAHLVALCRKKGTRDIYSFDSDLAAAGLKLIPIS